MHAQTFECYICTAESDEGTIRGLLQKALPELRWEEGDSSWDKVRVWGDAPGVSIRLYRYESPGPFQLTITLDAPPEHAALRDRVLRALGATVWTPL